MTNAENAVRWRGLASVTVGTGLQRGLGALLPLLVVVVATRQLGFDAAGIIGVSASVALLVAAAADLGISQAALREFPVTPPGRREFRQLVLLKLGLGLVACLGLAVVAAVAADPAWRLPLAVAAAMIPAFAATGLLTSKLAADGDGTVLAVAAGFGFVAGALAAVTAAGVSTEPAALLGSLALARTVEAGLLYGAVRLPRFATRGRYGFGWVLRSWPLSVIGLLQIVYLRGQVIIPGAILNAEATGKVVDGFNLYSAATLLPGALAVATWPAISRRVYQSPGAAVRLATRFAAVSVGLVSLPVAALLLFPGTFSDLLFGASSPSLDAYLRWGALATLFVAPNAIFLSLALSLGQERLVAAIWGIATGAALFLIWAFTDEYGVAGAGFAVAVSELLLAALILWAVLQGLRTHRGEGSLLEPRVRTVALAAVAGAVLALFIARFSFATPATGFLPLLAVPFALVFLLRSCRYDFMAPAAIFSLTWTAALGIAQFPLFPVFEWNSEMWWLVSLPPAALTLGAAVAAGRAGFHAFRSPFQHPPVPAAIVAGCAFVGVAAWIRYFSQLGVIPLLSDQIDVARFEAFGLSSLIGTRLGYVALIVAIPGIVLAPTWRQRLVFAAIAFVALVPLVLSGGRLYPFSACVIGGFAVILYQGVPRRLGLLVLAATILLVAGSSTVFFVRVDQQSDNPFKSHLDTELRPGRPYALQWTIPVQMATSVSFQTLADLTRSHAYELDPTPGLYSTKFADRFVPAKDLETVTRPTAQFQQVTTTYVGPWYADFGLSGVVLLSLLFGAANGLVWRWLRCSWSPTAIVLYSYAAFWLVYAIYLNYWTVHGVWMADVPFLVVLTTPPARWLSLWRRGVTLLGPRRPVAGDALR